MNLSKSHTATQSMHTKLRSRTKLFTVNDAIVNLSLPTHNLIFIPNLIILPISPKSEATGEASIPRVVQLPRLALLKGLDGF